MRHIRTIVILLIALAVGLVSSGHAGAASSVRITVARAGWYDVNEQLFIGEGDVVIEAEDVQIAGDYVEWRAATEELIVSGSVVFRQGDNELTGETLIYNLAQNHGEFFDVQALIEAEKAASPVFLRSDRVVLDGETYTIVDGRITTCDLEDPHFHLAVKEIERTADAKLIIRKVTYYEGSIPLFYWPYLVLPLDYDWQEASMLLPVIGYSTEEGYYIKTAFDYYFSENSYGVVNLDLFSKLGVGYGFTHHYKLGSLGSGKIEAYQIPFTEGHRLSAGLEHEWERGPWRFVTNNKYNNKDEKRSLDLRGRLTLNTQRIQAHAEGAYQENTGTKWNRSWEYGGTWRQQLADGWRLNLDGSVSSKERADERLRMVDYLAETTYTRGNHTWALAIEQEYNPDLLDDEVQKPTWRSVNRVPEFTWRVSSPTVYGTVLPLRLELSAGRYREFPSDTQGLRFNGTANLLNRTWRPMTGTTVTYGGELSTAFYDLGDQQTTAGGTISLNQQLSQNLRFTARFSEKQVWGRTPFQFDRVSPVRSVSLQLSRTGTPYTWSARTTYNFLTNKFSTLSLNGAWRPTDKLTLSVSGAYDLNSRVFGRVVPRIEYTTRDEQERPIAFRLGTMYHVEKQVWERIDLRVEAPFGETWVVGYDAVYDLQKQEFSSGQINIEKDLHCRSVTLSYDHVKQKVALGLTINAFPTLPLKWGSDTGMSLFDLDDVYDLIGVEQ
ncbi:MAG: LPS-assembly protein LptD [Firmicutes bacterium]|nr:LPS-assembly protein LptD [Bacillota bacterium]